MSLNREVSDSGSAKATQAPVLAQKFARGRLVTSARGSGGLHTALAIREAADEH